MNDENKIEENVDEGIGFNYLDDKADITSLNRLSILNEESKYTTNNYLSMKFGDINSDG